MSNWYKLLNRPLFWIMLPIFFLDTKWCYSMSDTLMLVDALLERFWLLIFLVIFFAPGRKVFE